jgi:hypothetical protein
VRRTVEGCRAQQSFGLCAQHVVITYCYTQQVQPLFRRTLSISQPPYIISRIITMATHRLTHLLMLSRVGQRYQPNEMLCQSTCGTCDRETSCRLTDKTEEGFLQGLILCKKGSFLCVRPSRKSQRFMGLEGSLSCSPEHATGLYLSQMNPVHALPYYFSRINVNILPSRCS